MICNEIKLYGIKQNEKKSVILRATVILYFKFFNILHEMRVYRIYAFDLIRIYVWTDIKCT